MWKTLNVFGEWFQIKIKPSVFFGFFAFFFCGGCLGRKVLGIGAASLEERFVLEHCFWKSFLSIDVERSSVCNFVPVLVLLVLGSRVALIRHKAKVKLTSSYFCLKLDLLWFPNVELYLYKKHFKGQMLSCFCKFSSAEWSYMFQREGLHITWFWDAWALCSIYRRLDSLAFHGTLS